MGIVTRYHGMRLRWEYCLASNLVVERDLGSAGLVDMMTISDYDRDNCWVWLMKEDWYSL